MISVIIPVYNEAGSLTRTVEHLKSCVSDPSELEIFVSDGGSVDGSQKEAELLDVGLVHSDKAQRAYQMNLGAKRSSGEVLYFLHADSLPPPHFDQSIRRAIKAGALSGCFTMKFDSDHFLMQVYGWFTKFSANIFRGGDQSLFVDRALFEELSGFDESFDIMEDYDIIKRLKAKNIFKIIRGPVITSSRKYARNGILRLQWIFLNIHIMHRRGKSQQEMKNYYASHIK